MHQRVQQIDERRPRSRKRRSDDGLAEAVKGILARHVSSISVAAAGCFCIFMPIAFGVAGVDYWPLVVAYGGCLVGVAVSGVV